MEWQVLVADDMFINRMLIRSVLKKIPGIKYQEATDGLKTMQAVLDNDFDLIILDLMMPGKNGFQVLAELKNSERHKHIPVIICSALHGIENINLALQAGAHDYFIKPLTIEQMNHIVPVKVKNALDSYSNHKKMVNLNKKLNEELLIAATFQKMLIDADGEYTFGKMYGKYMPCDAVGGDYYECREEEGDMWFIMADVSGHGLAAAMMSSMVKVVFYNAIKTSHSPIEVLQTMNRTFCKVSNDDYYLTALIGVIRRGSMSIANAGHPYPAFWDCQAKNIRLLEQQSFPIGMFEEASYAVETIPVHGGDKLFVYTDGLLDSIALPPARSGPWRLLECFKDGAIIADAMSDAFFPQVLSYFMNEGGQEPVDDIAMMLIEVMDVIKENSHHE